MPACLSPRCALIDNGTTTIVDISQIAHSPEHSDANIQALKDSGIRAVFAYSRGEGPVARYPEDLIRLRNTYFNSAGPVAQPWPWPPALIRNFPVCPRRAGVRSVLHIRVNSEPLLALGRAGLLRPGDEFIHCTHLDDRKPGR